MRNELLYISFKKQNRVKYYKKRVKKVLIK